MTQTKKLLHIGIIMSLLGVFFMSTTPARAAGTTILVNTTDGGSSAGDGFCSLQEAVAAANTDTAQDGGACPAGNGTDTIAFDLPGSGVRTIPLTTSLTISAPVILDGTTDPHYAGTPVVKIDGNDAALWGVYLGSGSSGSTVKGLMITRFGYGQLVLSSSDNTTVVGNYIGTDGVAGQGGGNGILVEGSNGVVIGGGTAALRNVIAGNYADLGLHSGSTNALVQGNYIGLLADGATTIAGQSYGILINPTSSPNTGGPANAFGGPAIGEGNVIAGHGIAEIFISSDDQSLSDGNKIQGNIIGLEADGSTLPAFHGGDGIKIVNTDSTLIENNVISGKANAGIVLYFDSSLNPGGGTPVAPDGTDIIGNKIGTSQDGANVVGNGTGIDVGDSSNTTIGGPTFADANLISGNSVRGINLASNLASGTTIQRNLIGVVQTGAGTFSNAGNGSHSAGDANIAVVSATAPLVTNNWIANGANNGLLFDSAGTLASGSTGNCIQGNISLGANQATLALIPMVGLSGNWWGSATGPTHSANPGGTGDGATDNVDYSGFLTAAPAACAAIASLDIPSISFGNQLVGAPSVVRTVTLTNTGIKLLTLSSITASSSYLLDATGTCQTGGSLVPAGSCTIKVKFKPVAAGPTPGTVTISSNASGSPALITLNGTGKAGTQLLKNVSFETDANNDQKPDNWAYAGFNVVTDKRDCTLAKAGLCSLKLGGNGAIKTAVETVLKSGVAGDDFAFKLWSRSVSVPVGAIYRLNVSLYNGASLLSSQNLNFTTGTHGFKQLTGSLAAPGPYTKVVFKITYKAASGSVWFDATSLTWAP